MRIEFQAKKVSYGEAIAGEIAQAWFEEDDEDDPVELTHRYLLISTGYEFGPPTADAEWFDGKDFNGGIRVAAFHLREGKAWFRLENGYIFEIGHKADALVLENIRAYLSRHCIDIDA